MKHLSLSFIRANVLRKFWVVGMCWTLSGLFITGCGRTQHVEAAAVAAPACEAPVEAAATVTDPYAKFDHVVDVAGTEVGLKEMDGYKPYVIHFIYYKQDIEGDCTDGNAYFRDSNGKTVSLDEAKEKGIIADYELMKSDEMLVMYVNENRNGLSLMPAPGPGELRLNFESDIKAYSIMWSDAAMAKIGLGNEYKMIDISPDDDFDNDDVVCVKNVTYEDYFHGAFGSNVGQYYLFVNHVSNGDYSVIR